MKKNDFLNNNLVAEFINFLSSELPRLKIHLEIKQSAKVPGGISTQIEGLGAVLQNYKWNSGYINQNNERISGLDWISTKVLLNTLGEELRNSCERETEENTKEIALKILKWGGDRNHKVGATVDINNLFNENRLNQYLLASREKLSSENCSIDLLKDVNYTGSMWTKIYSLNSFDALPIYDSRVAMALIGLLSIFFSKLNLSLHDTSEELSFGLPVGTNWLRNKNLIDLTSVKRMTKNDLRWNQDAMKLAWIMETVLANSDLFWEYEQLVDRKHAFEASFFMIGYDLKSII
jgi:hypothetical protein